MNRIFIQIREFIKQNALFLIGILLTICYVYSDVLFGNWKISFSNLIYTMPPWDSLGAETKGPLLSDIIDNLLPTIFSTIRSKEYFQFWNGMVGLGASEDISMVMYPLYLLYLLPIDWATFLKSMLQIGVGFFSLFLLLREWNCNKMAAAMGGIIYTFCSSMVCWHGWPHSDVAMFAPFAFLLTDRLVRRVKLSDMIWLTVVFYLMLVAGMPTFVAYFLYLLGAFLLVKTIQLYRKEYRKILIVFVLFGISVLLAACMSFPYTAQILLSVGNNGYAQSRTIQAELSLEMSFLYLVFFPDWNLPLQRAFNECTIYVGMAGLWMLLFTGIRFRQKKQVLFWATAWIVLAVLIFTPVLNVIFTRLPAVNSSVKFRVIVLWNFVTALLAGFNLQDIMEHLDYYKKKWFYLFPIFGVLALAWGWAKQAYEKEADAAYQIAVDLKWDTNIIFFVVIGIGLLLLLYMRTGKKWFLLGLMALTVYDLGGFAKNYFPYIEKGMMEIPDATDSIQFLQENTKDGERVIAVGQWLMFPNMNMFYGLKDIRSHNFVNTNRDLQTLFKPLDRWFYTTSTRTALWDIEDYELLKYLGVRYIMSLNEKDTVNYIETAGNYNVVDPMTSGVSVVQEFISRKDRMTAVSVQVATYGRQMNSDERLRIMIKEKNGAVISQEETPLFKLTDNMWITLQFDPIDGSEGKMYEICLENMSQNVADSISIWHAGSEQYEGNLYVNGKEEAHDLLLKASFDYEDMNLVYSGQDGVFVNELTEYHKRFELPDSLYVAKEEKYVLGWMADSDYLPNSIFLSEEYYNDSEAKIVLEDRAKVVASTEKDNPSFLEILFSNDADNHVKLLNERDDRIELAVQVNEPRLLMFNEYYDKNWNVYIDGVKAPLMRANYIMRAVFLPDAGEHNVVFSYEPTYMYILIGIASASFILWVICIVLRKKIQSGIEKLGG